MNKAIIINPYQLTVKEVQIDFDNFENIIEALNDDLPNNAPKVEILTRVSCEHCVAYVDDCGLLNRNPVGGTIYWLYTGFLAGNIVINKPIKDIPRLPACLKVINEPTQKLVAAEKQVKFIFG